MTLYEPDVRIVARSGDTIAGRDAVRDMLAGLITTNTRLQSRVLRSITVGDIALLCTDFEGTAVDSSGKTADVRYSTIEVLRRQHDGTWKLIVGDPNGRN